MPDHAWKISKMVQPQSLRTQEYRPWSRGRGEDVWAMLCAAVAGDIETIRKLLAQDPQLVNCEYEYFTPLRLAVRENHLALAEFLFDQAGDSAYEPGESLLEIARERGYTEITAFLESKLAAKYNVSPGAAAVSDAIRNRDTTRVRELLDAQPDLIHAADERGNQPIHWAVMTRQLGLIDYLLAQGGDINARRPDGLRPLHLTNGDYHYRGWRDLPATALQRHEALIGYLIARGADYDIGAAAKLGDLDRVRELLDSNPDLVSTLPTYSYYTGTPLRNAAGAGHIEVVKLLLERGADPNQPEPGIAPHGGALHAAIGGKHMAIVELLLERGANPNAEVESSGNCMLMAKHVKAPQEMIDLIASYGGVMGADLADVETLAAMLHANPQLPVGERLDNPAMRRLILKYQPDILRRVPDPTAWWSLATPPSPEIARWAMEHGLDPNRPNWLGITLLHRCAAKGEIANAEICLGYGADINGIETDTSSTPLGWAAREGWREMVEWLLDKGADPGLPNDEKWALPLAWAERRGHAAVAEILRRV